MKIQQKIMEASGYKNNQAKKYHKQLKYEFMRIQRRRFQMEGYKFASLLTEAHKNQDKFWKIIKKKRRKKPSAWCK